MRKKYDVVIVNYNGEKILIECLESIFHSELISSQVIVFDNASTDGSCELIKKKYPRVKLIESDKNIGFGPGNNAALLHVTAPYTFFVNNDVKVDAHCTLRLIDFLDKNRKITVVNPLIKRGWDKKGESIYSYGANINTAGFGYSLMNLGVQEDFLNCFSGACFMARTNEIKFLRFEPSYFLYYEEPELSVRLLKQGHTISRVQDAIVYHLENYSSPHKKNEGIAFRQFYGIQNRWYMLGKHWPFRLWLNAFFFNSIHLGYFLFFYIRTGQLKYLKIVYLAPFQLIRGLGNRLSDKDSIINKNWHKNLHSVNSKDLLIQKKNVFKS